MRLLQMSFSGTLIILVVVLIRMAAIHKLPKRTFLVLWEVVLIRLLIPYSIPSVLSMYSFIARKMPVDTNGIFTEIAAGNAVLHTGNMMSRTGNMMLHSGNEIAVTEMQPMEFLGKTGPSPMDAVSSASVSGWFWIWLAGALFCMMFFAVTYLRCRLEFRASLPVQNDFVNRWLKAHRLRRSVSIRQSDRISAPLTYGIFKPVILMPKSTDWGNTGGLQYVLLHEYMHIRHYDAMIKIILAFALSIHWFNPFVWMMYFVFNRDIELACDESVVREFGETSKSTYARMLISMEAEKSGILPFCNSFSKNAMEERITAIMKIKRTSVFAMLAAVLLTVSVTVVFATSASEGETGKNNSNVPRGSFTEEEMGKLLALRFDGYETMSVSAYQNKVWELTDTAEYQELWKRLSEDEELYQMKDDEETASFLFYTLEPLTAERWQMRDFGGYCMTDYPAPSDQAMLEFTYTLTIQDADALTVREYQETRMDMLNGLQGILQDKTDEQLQDEAVMQEMIDGEIENLIEKWSTDKLRVSVEYCYMPLLVFDGESGTEKGERQIADAEEGMRNVDEKEKRREYPYGTKEDYQALLALKTKGYRNMPVAEFNMLLLEWANENYERMERIDCDTRYQDFAVPLDEEELSFITVSVYLSGQENGKYVQSNYTGRAEEDPSYSQYLPEKADEKEGRRAWCDLYYQFSYHITDRNVLTVGERDTRVSGMISGIQEFWDETDLEELLKMDEADIVKKLSEIAAAYSSEEISFSIFEDWVGFEKMDERGIN